MLTNITLESFNIYLPLLFYIILYIPIYLSIYLSIIYLSIHLSIYLCIHLSSYPSIYHLLLHLSTYTQRLRENNQALISVPEKWTLLCNRRFKLWPWLALAKPWCVSEIIGWLTYNTKKQKHKPFTATSRQCNVYIK